MPKRGLQKNAVIAEKKMKERVTMLSKSSLSPSRFLAVLAIAFTGLLLAGCGINNIPTYEQDAKAKWSEVLSQYKRRAELIPNLVETVKGFADQEKSV